MRSLRFLVLITALALSLPSCSNDPQVTDETASPTARPGACSAASVEAPEEPSGLPVDVAMMRKEIIKAAIGCDYDLLDRLGVNGAATFNYSFGQPSERPDAKPGAYWETQEERGEPVLETLLRLFRLRFAVTTADETIYVWPSAAGEAPSDDDWSELEREFDRDEVGQWRQTEGYLGPRVGITARGDWLFYVAGD